ncbi:hypothetical protein Goklo_000781 [Gossypium klotzschianum]|uniref:AMP-activated protein kinase glycogen-binding domain-containing protein n=1 Tax=Gossypium klotzschianum TaxID=34286 RepID=A0A7J8VY91_9ROSI|nr:hypothetical protein [Gossypium klotzschianum]
MSEKMWDVKIKHAKTCVMGNKYYVFQGTNYRVFLNPICQLVKAESNGTTYTIQTLSSINRVSFILSSNIYIYCCKKFLLIIMFFQYRKSKIMMIMTWKENIKTKMSWQRSGKDHSVLLVLPSGIYHYKFIVDGEWRYTPDLPFIADEMGRICNLLDVHVCIF